MKTNRRQGNKNLTTIITLFVVNFFLLTSCPEDMQFGEMVLPEGQGSLSLYIDEISSSRTILPKNTDWSSFSGTFEIDITGQPLITRNINNLSSPIVLDAGNYDITVTALDGTAPFARGQINITVIAGEPSAHIIRLRAIFEAGVAGTFGWNVTIPAAATGQMLITRIDGTPVGAEDLAQGANSGTRVLDCDYYFVTTTLKKTGRVDVIRRDVLHIYQNMTSVFAIEFADALFNNSLHYVTFDFNYGSLSEMEPVIHGEPIAKPSPDPQRNGYGFAGWFTEAAAVNAFNFSQLVLNDITLYASWIPNTASITLTVAQIENGDPIFSAPVVVSRNGIGVPAVFNVNVPSAGNYSHFKWEIAGVGLMPSFVSEGASASAFTINGANPNYGTLGGHVLKLTVTRNGILYQVNIPFTIVETIPPVEVSTNGVITGYADLASAFGAIGTNAGNYVITLGENQTMTANRTINSNQHITITGKDEMRTINCSTAGTNITMFSINSNASLTLGNNVTIQGRTEAGSGDLVFTSAGTFRMLEGSRITGHQVNSATSAAVYVGTSGRFEMSGGSIDGNNSTVTATSTNAAGGVIFTGLSGGIFIMTGGSITGNTQGPEASDMYHETVAAGSFTMSGSASIGALKMNAPNSTTGASVNIGEGWTGSIDRLNLRGTIADIAAVSQRWDNRMLFSGISSAKVNSIALGEFISSGNDRQAIVSLCFIGTSGNDLGRLLAFPATAAVTVSANGVTSGFLSLTAAFAFIGSQEGEFTVTLRENQTMTANRTINFNQNITITGSGGMRTIDGSTIGTAVVMFTLNFTSASLTLGNNITLQGRTNAGTAAVVNNTNGTFRMLEGSRITGHASSSATSAAVNITGASSVFEMSGGSIDGNNNTIGATNTNATGGVYFTGGTFTMSGGSITGNTQGTEASDTYHAVTTANRFTMSGNASIGTLKLNATSTTAGATMSIGTGWTGNITTLNLRGEINAIATALGYWTNSTRTILNGITAAQVARIGLGEFISSNNTRQTITDTHIIGTTGTELGVLVERPIIPGSGTPADPFNIYNETELRAVGRGTYNGMSWSTSAHYRLMNNITLTGGNWTRIGDIATGFSGTFNGNGKTIAGMTVAESSTAYQGMFCFISPEGVVRNLGLVNVNITGFRNVGGIAGDNEGTIENCFVTGSITGTETQIGGIAGYNLASGTIQNCYVIANITGANDLGGITGYASLGIIRNCYVAGTITGGVTSNTFGVGGISGSNAMSVQNTVTLLQSITVTSGTGYNKITGVNLTGGSLANKRAWSGTVLSPVKTATSNLTGVNGLDVTAAVLKTQAAWQASGAAFSFGTSDASPWVWQDGKMPRLHWETGSRDWPAYFTD
ncbi:MAG: InlB B-repeat-containing protein [Treponema sp.]|nr:InlB B-repeat-containing protein [Treponema sp.]MCL2236757.1 InlB B-repeat-containing protein [Treponema sp.]